MYECLIFSIWSAEDKYFNVVARSEFQCEFHLMAKLKRLGIWMNLQVQLEPTIQLLSRGGVYGVSKYTGIFQATKDILKEEGMLGLWISNNRWIISI